MRWSTSMSPERYEPSASCMRELAFHVRAFVPSAEGEELEYRISLLRARDFAAAIRGKRDGWLSQWLACEAHETAGAIVFAMVSTERLRVAVQFCRHLVSAANLAEFLEIEEDVE